MRIEKEPEARTCILRLDRQASVLQSSWQRGAGFRVGREWNGRSGSKGGESQRWKKEVKQSRVEWGSEGKGRKGRGTRDEGQGRGFRAEGQQCSSFGKEERA